MLLPFLLFWLSGCVSDVVIENRELAYKGNSPEIFKPGEKPARVFIPNFEDLREDKENVVGSQTGFRLVIPYHQKYKVEGHPPVIVRRYVADQLADLGIQVVPAEAEADAVLRGALREFSRMGWGVTLTWGNSSRIVLDLDLLDRKHGKVIWQETFYGEGDELNESLEQIANNLEADPDFKSVLARLAQNPEAFAHSSPVRTRARKTREDGEPPVIEIHSPDPAQGRVLAETRPEIFVRGTVTDNGGIREVTVNGKPVTLSEKGNFRIRVPLAIGVNRILVEARDNNDHIAAQTLSIRRVAMASGQTAPVNDIPFGRFHALVIGNQNYRFLPPLKTPHADAREVARVLRERFGFQTRVILDGTRDDIMETLNRLSVDLTEGDNLLIYYAGHGEFDPTAQKAYWQPVDARPDSDTKWIIVDSITSNIKRTAARHILIVADSCYSGTLTRSFRSRLGGGRGAERRQYIVKMFQKPSRTLMASGGNEPVSDAGGGRHSIFADVFLRALRSIEEPVFTSEDLFYQYIKESVGGRADQTPEYTSIRNSGHDGGDFVFRLHKTPAPVAGEKITTP